MEKFKEDFIDIFELITLLKKNIILILFCATLGGTAMGLYAKFMVTPQYVSDAQLLVAQQNIEQTNPNVYNNAINSIKANLEMIPTYRDILFSSPVLGEVSERFDGRYSAPYLKERLTFIQAEDSQSFTVSIRMENPQEAQAVLAEITSVFSATLEDIYSEGFGKVVVLSPASYKEGKVSPNILKNAVTGVLAGVFIAFGIIVIKNYFDRTIKNDGYLQAQNLTLLTEIYDMSTNEIDNARFVYKQ